MEIAIVTGGTRGDVQPYVALGRGLRLAGHRVHLLGSDDFAALTAEAGLTFHPTGDSVEALLQQDEWRATIEGGNPLATLARMRRAMREGATDAARRLRSVLAGAELVVAGLTGLTGAFSVAESLGIPFVQAHTAPFTPTRAFPSPLLPTLPFGGAGNRLSFGVARQLFWQTFRESDNATRRELGLARGPLFGPYRALERRRVPTLYGYSSHVLPRPADWPAEDQVTGYWFLDAPAGWAPPPDLAAFLDSGEPPVYIGFGSMGSRDPAATAQLAVEALARAGRRGILAAGWGGLATTDLPATVFPIGAVPHAWLFPRMAAIVHHGGAGTTAAALRSGVPSVVVPFGLDQPFWGRRVAELGVGPPPLARKALTARRLANALRDTLADGAIRERAAALGRTIEAEDGIGTAVALIERHAPRDARTGRR
jgi:sterol 3beta-glucosyltransferase